MYATTRYFSIDVGVVVVVVGVVAVVVVAVFLSIRKVLVNAAMDELVMGSEGTGTPLSRVFPLLLPPLLLLEVE